MRSIPHPAVSTANDRFKQGFGSRFWIALTLATLAHAAVFLLAPGIAVDAVAAEGGGVEFVPLPDYEIPEPPEVVRPAEPVFGAVEVDPTLTIPSTSPDAYDPGDLAPPPPAGGDPSDTPFFTPTLRPRLLNEGEIRGTLTRFYPPVLRDAGIGGTVHVWFFLDETGRVVKTQIDRSSGYADLDAAALEVADRMEFSPAENRDRKVPVWVSVPITFEVQRD
ncbi:MAG: energy transducer TonB [Gemmatimonadota bacterium]